MHDPSNKRSHLSNPHRTPGDTNITRFPGFDFHPEVFITSGILILLFVLLTVLFKEPAETAFGQIQTFIAEGMGWFLILAVSIYLSVAILLALSRFGSVRIGGQDARPEFPTFAWLAMLLSAGMGIGLMFWSVAEPIYHFQSPPTILGTIEPGTNDAAQQALSITFFHWGFHAWGIYALVGLALAFFAYNRGLPLTVRSVFYPLLGDGIYGWMGNVVDVLAVTATLFGLATSLGFGVQQVNAGFNFLFDLPINAPVQVVLIAIITGFATASVVSGLDAGVRRLSELNMILAAILMVFVLLAGPTIFLLGTFVQTTGFYLASLPTFSFWTETFQSTSWQNSWTVFYWGWWISWSPFVGIFIARISKGRTVREFILGVLLLPSLLTFLWMSVFGGTALNLELGDSPGIIADAVNAEVATALFVMLQQLPLTGLTSFVGIILVVVFFVTSSDSGSLVVDNLTSGGKLDSPVPQRVFWAAMEGVVAAVLLLGGGLTALQTAAITTGLPFAIVLLVMCYSLYRGLGEEYAVIKLKSSSAAAPTGQTQIETVQKPIEKGPIY
ncbi:BCCT family transporter [Roseofilum sp. Belize BBD 4]|uniref:BCCT family transporter n=1 Tax=unclassified Roseofilum TaxID=2620099 RepID=UPI000E8401B7|nr:BCCT family transporter [Roseofilum sp. Belize BBD 4]MBP0008837.1 BCCT family transporter [Roseofilum sp. Belize Diploria]MBP0012903.1 BCCT family transporter [Roseofilum sp. SID3]MBP0026582.1 BCCT family transporter [Roseofilum sp. SID2]MBP0037367.1 BCCT family transporter [Roseofilum sp. SID1]MBP0040760.1 BCCT family transporter [Roseofilum sp. SBFL]HBQ97815.1 choline transporter [Cyanobacteria bacterium UBA11691]